MAPSSDVICFSHHRWSFAVQRPNHLMSRCARTRRVFFVEEPLFDGGPPRLTVEQSEQGPRIVVPHFSRAMEPEQVQSLLPRMLDKLLEQQRLHDFTLWYTTPMALDYTRHLAPQLLVYDCMEELSQAEGAPADLPLLERELFTRVDLVFTAGQALYEAKRREHPNVFSFPSSVDLRHFGRARQLTTEPRDQAGLAHPRLGYLGPVDRRLDLSLVMELAALRPHWQLVMVGPVSGMEEKHLPCAANLHWLGARSHAELPAYLAGWDAAFFPYAMRKDAHGGAAPRTPEILAAGRAVISTPIPDVVEPYGNRGLVQLAHDAAGFAAAFEAVRREDPSIRIGRADSFLARSSWDATWEEMSRLMEQARARPHAANEDDEAVTAA